MKVLAVQSGIFGDHSQSTQLVQQLLDALASKHGSINVTRRDLSANPLPYYDASVAMALSAEPDKVTAEQSEIIALSDELIAEIESADIIVLGVPMYNFGIPAQMKSWFDLIARAGVTFRYTETGPVGIMKDRPVYVAAARGGMHLGQPTDSQTPYIQTMLGFLGLKSVEIVYAEGLAMGDDARNQALAEFEASMAKAM